MSLIPGAIPANPPEHGDIIQDQLVERGPEQGLGNGGPVNIRQPHRVPEGGAPRRQGENLQSTPTAARYIALAQALLAIATFAGSITFSALLAYPSPTVYVRTLLGFAVALFFGSVTGIFPILIRMQIVKDQEPPKGWTRLLVLTGLTVVTVLIIVAFALLLAVVREYTSVAAFVVGAVLVGSSAMLTGVAAAYNVKTLVKARKAAVRERVLDSD